MLAIAGVVTWIGYAVFTYGLSQVAGKNYSFLDLVVPGKFVLNQPPPDPPNTGGGSTLTPCTAAQTKAGWTMSNAGCIPPSSKDSGTPGNPNATGCPTGYHKNANGVCVKAYR